MSTRNRAITWSAIGGTAVLVGLFVATLLLRLGTTASTVAPLPYLTVAAMDLLPVAALGAALLLVAALLARSHRAAIGLGILVPVASVAIGMIWHVAVASSGWSVGGVVVVAYWLGLAFLAAAGVSLSRELIASRKRTAPGEAMQTSASS